MKPIKQTAPQVKAANLCPTKSAGTSGPDGGHYAAGFRPAILPPEILAKVYPAGVPAGYPYGVFTPAEAAKRQAVVNQILSGKRSRRKSGKGESK